MWRSFFSDGWGKQIGLGKVPDCWYQPSNSVKIFSIPFSEKWRSNAGVQRAFFPCALHLGNSKKNLRNIASNARSRSSHVRTLRLGGQVMTYTSRLENPRPDSVSAALNATLVASLCIPLLVVPMYAILDFPFSYLIALLLTSK